jgi:hypothetical protein
LCFGNFSTNESELPVNLLNKLGDGPGCFFIILLFFILFILTCASLIGLCRKIFRSKMSTTVKLLLIALLVGLLVAGIITINTAYTSDALISPTGIGVFSASLIMGLNWSINLTHGRLLKRISLPAYIKVAVMTIVFTILIPIIFYFTGDFFDKLNLMGSGG